MWESYTIELEGFPYNIVLWDGSPIKHTVKIQEKNVTIRSYFMAKIYDASMKEMEDACMSNWRQELLSDISGDVLEIGSGTGINLPHYPMSVHELTLTEPEPHMLNLLKSNINGDLEDKCILANHPAETLNFPDNTFDAVVSTLVLCSVDSVEKTLYEIKRVLKPEGKFYFIEHVIAKDTPKLIKWQKLFKPFVIYMCGNCHLTRDTETSISNAGFEFKSIERLKSTGSPAIVSPTIKGIAINVKDA